MKVVFAGTPDFARHAFEAIVDAGHAVVLVLTQPDRPAGRGMKLLAGPVKQAALARGVPVIQPRGLRIGGRFDDDARDAHARLVATPHDAMVVAAYGLILPQAVLDVPPLGCLNVHASLLPRWRGAAPVQRAIEAGDAITGTTIMRMDAGLDTGPVLLERPLPIDPDDTGGSLTERLARQGGAAIVDALAALARGDLPARPQHAAGDASGVVYAPKIAKQESLLGFDLPTRTIVDRVRAFDPWPGITTRLVGRADAAPTTWRVWRARPVSPRIASLRVASSVDPAQAGQVLGFVAIGDDAGDAVGDKSDGGRAVLVRTADGVVALTELQKPGGRRQPASAFAHDFADPAGLRFERPDTPASS